jgi:hypothetical protein
MVASVTGDQEFVDLRRLADWFSTLAATDDPSGARSAGSAVRTAHHIRRVVRRLGTTCVPLLGRELASCDHRRRDAAREALHSLAVTARARVIAELQQVAASARDDDAKVCALGLLAELGASGAARFADPSAVQRRSAIALAAQLDAASDVAATADLMIRQLEATDMIQLVEVMADAVPTAAARLASELCARVELDCGLREHLEELAAGAAPPSPVRRAPRPTHVTLLVDAAARIVVVASRRFPGERRWRRWAVLIDQQGRIDDCFHEDDAVDDVDPLVATLIADGYRTASSDLEHACALVAAAARKSAEARALPSAYYLGRDLLDLGEAHLGARPNGHGTLATLGRAVELIADGEHARAQALLARCATDSPDAAAAIAACALASGEPADAVPPLLRAIDAEPEWPLHHWNLAAACHRLGDARGCYHALRRFVATSARRSGLCADPEQPSRVVLARKMIADLERAARLSGTTLARTGKHAATSRRRPAQPPQAPR